jgi:hypothetical protein
MLMISFFGVVHIPLSFTVIRLSEKDTVPDYCLCVLDQYKTKLRII